MSGSGTPSGAALAAMPDTLPRLLRRNAQSMSDRPAIREKTLGIWQTFTLGRIPASGG